MWGRLAWRDPPNGFHHAAQCPLVIAPYAGYVHFNPVKHGLVERVCEWPYSTFHRLVERGVYPLDWAGGGDVAIEYAD